MPVRDKTEPEAYCDVCGQPWSETCAICGGVFCGEHTILIEFKRGHWILNRRLCKKCLSTPTSLWEVIRGQDPSSWQNEEVPFPELPKFMVMQTDKMP